MQCIADNADTRMKGSEHQQDMPVSMGELIENLLIYNMAAKACVLSFGDMACPAMRRNPRWPSQCVLISTDHTWNSCALA
jgi:hypothetical protein